MEQIMIFTQTNDVTVVVYYDEEKNQIILQHKILKISAVFDDPKNALVDFITYLLDYAIEITWINEELFEISPEEIDWMKKHPRFELLMNQLECLKGKL